MLLGELLRWAMRITSAGRSWPLGPVGIVLTSMRSCKILKGIDPAFRRRDLDFPHAFPHKPMRYVEDGGTRVTLDGN